ncbi:MAG: hypothetical protein NTZ09_02485 [Candidatus Hydrogenedentes bacterium]|nr:hypothetical protein [Candidatus Hydrogenedentota bacterium]
MGNIYAGGQFTRAGEVVVNGIAKWDGAAWAALGTGTYSDVYALAVDNSGNVYVGLKRRGRRFHGLRGFGRVFIQTGVACGT